MRRADRAALYNAQRILGAAHYSDADARKFARLIVGRVLLGVERRRLMRDLRAFATEAAVIPPHDPQESHQ